MNHRTINQKRLKLFQAYLAEEEISDATIEKHLRNVRAFSACAAGRAATKGLVSDEGVEDAIYDSYAVRKFTGINFLEMDVPESATLLKCRHLLEEHGLGKLYFDAIIRCLECAVRMMRGKRIVDATLISAPSSTEGEKNRDPEMHQTKKDNRWHFGMKCQTGVDVGSGFVHTVEVTAANVHINRRPGRLPRVSDRALDWERHIEHQKSSVRCKVEHPYRIVKNIFGFRKTVYRRLSKKLNRLYVLFASTNLYMLVRAGGSLPPVYIFASIYSKRGQKSSEYGRISSPSCAIWRDCCPYKL